MLKKPDGPREYNLIELRAENFMKLKAVRITPDGGIFKITGRNEQGKSAVLNAVEAAIGGPKAFPKAPVRKGADEATLELDFGGLQLKRKIWNKPEGGIGHSLTLQYSDGKRPKEPQHVLDTLRGSPIADDPIEFARMDAKKRLDLLRQLVPDFDFEDHAERRKEMFDDRTQVGRDLKRAQAIVDSISLPRDCPTERVDVTALAADLRAAHDANALIDTRQRRRNETRDAIGAARDEADRKTVAANALLAEAAALNKQADDDEAKLQGAEALPAKADTSEIERQLSAAGETNDLAQMHHQKAEAIRERDGHAEKQQLLTQGIEESDRQKAEAIAKAKLPIKEITFGDDDILLDGLPFDQASTARKIRVSTALLMALKPDLRVLLVREGSLLDNDARAALAADAKAHNFVVLMECVTESIDGDGVLIEDGEIV